MRMSRRNFMIASAAGATGLAPGCAQAPPASILGAPPLWLVRRHDAKVYVYGDFGSITPKWSAPHAEAAFAESRVFWKETADLAPGDEQKFIAPGLAGDRPLSTWLTPAQKDIVAAAALEAGTTYEALDRLKPWLAAISIGRAYDKRRSQGQAPTENPIAILTARALEQGKPVYAELADAEAQLDLVNGMSATTQVEYLLYTIENYRQPQDAIDRRRRAWAAGDLSLEKRQVEHFKADFPNLYEPFELRRNRAWPARIRQMLDEGGTAFVLVGADHLVGPDSVLVQLAIAGLAATRI